MQVVHGDFDNLISLENLLRAWRKFKIGKDKKSEVIRFERYLEDNLFSLYHDLKSQTYRHGEYHYFTVSDPKKRDIHKAAVRDRIVHQALYDYLVEIYESIFIDESYSSRLGKGTHRAVLCLKNFAQDIFKENKGECFALKCDIKKFFANIYHNILLNILKRKIKDKDVVWLIEIVVKSFKVNRHRGVPLGNITSQIFANVYLNELDYFVKKELKLKHYLRYNDDFVILSEKQDELWKNIGQIKEFLGNNLFLEMPEGKIIFRKLRWGIDFCGYIVLPNAVLLRQKTKKRMLKKIAATAEKYAKGEIAFSDYGRVLDSYLGLLKYCDSYNLKNTIKNRFVYAP